MIGCFYRNSLRIEKFSPLEKNAVADVCVIGAGYSGLSVAQSLAEAGADVILLDREYAGWGASGRNGGQLLHGFNQSFGSLTRQLGEEPATALWLDTLKTIRAITRRVEDWRIPCDWRNGVVIAAPNSGSLRSLSRETELWSKHLHHKVEVLDHDDTHNLLGTRAYVGGAFDASGSHFHPLKYARGFAHGLAERGVRIHEMSPVVSVNGEHVYTRDAKIAAKIVVYCGGAYQKNLLPELRERVVILRTSMLATAPIPPQLGHQIMRLGASVYEWRNLLNYFRMTDDRRLLFGGGDSALSKKISNDRNAYRGLYDAMTRIFPQLRGIQPTHYWSGAISMTTTNMPYVGKIGENTYFTGGYCGHGIVPAHLLGSYIAEAILGRPEKMDLLQKLKPAKLPGGGSFDGVLCGMGLARARIADDWTALTSGLTNRPSRHRND